MPKRTLLCTAALGGLLVFACTGCHYDRETAGRPDAEAGNGLDGSVTATKEGTGDPTVGSGRGQVGTDAPEKRSNTEAPTDTGEHPDASGGRK